jgi:hopene-associated glycosyltransferase HpnB
VTAADFTALAALAPLAAWAYLLLFRGGFWRADQRLSPSRAMPPVPPPVVAVMPARNEAAFVGAAVSSLLAQDYPNLRHVVLVDDGSDDGTAAAAGRSPRLSVVRGRPLPEGWTGKLWAVRQGLERAREAAPEAVYALFADADIEHPRESLSSLVAKAEAERLDLVSLMARLRCESAWERLLVPAFVFFFQKLYPFPWVNDPGRPEAAAAGGCMLVRLGALERAGGVQAIRDRVIDDVALARALKAQGRIWLGLSETVVSRRPYPRLGDVWNMVARTAYVQLRDSPALLLLTVFGMAALYLAPPLAAAAGALAADGALAAAGAAAWALMALAVRPTLALYRQPAWLAPLLPAAALLFTLMTLDSARRHRRGQGAGWKGRTYGPQRARG